MEKTKRKWVKWVILSIVICAIITPILYVTLRPEVDYIKFDGITYASEYTDVKIKIKTNEDYAISAEDFTINSDGLPIKAYRILRGNNLYSEYKISSDIEKEITIRFKINKYFIDSPTIICFKGENIIPKST